MRANPVAARPDLGTLTFIVDVDNTLLDNDALLAAIDLSLRSIVPVSPVRRFWELYEASRVDRGFASVTHAIESIRRDLGHDVARVVADAIERVEPARYLYPRALEVVGHLRTMGAVVIFSEGTPAYQERKIARAGIAEMADAVIVLERKEEHPEGLLRAFPADRYVLIDDKTAVLARLRGKFPDALIVRVRQGKYADAGDGTAADLTVERVGDLLRLGGEDFRSVRQA